ncbi:restriction endonuclease [Psychrobacillus sp. FSL H8-0487]|uniref:restriction endonuclease n=1 Tax=Psychrobacillus sp. FSL H8-0487 TaxID=2921391 RepID=UPI0030FAACDC
MARSKKKQKNKGQVTNLLVMFFFIVTLLLTKDLFYAFGVGVLTFLMSVTYQSVQRSKELDKIRRSGISEIDIMDGFQFEHYLVELFKSEGYSAVRTSDSGDFGADVILKKDGKKIVVQAKRYRNNVGIKAVQEVIGALNFYKAEEAWVVSNSEYTKAAKQLAQESNVKLVNRTELIERMSLLEQQKIKPDPLEVKNDIPVKEKKTCPDCGSSMILRNSKRGVFYGCSSFPKCTGVRQAN